MEIFASLSGETPFEVATRYDRYGDLKNDLSALVIEHLSPIAERHRSFMADPVELSRQLMIGSAHATTIAGPVYERAAHAMGLIG